MNFGAGVDLGASYPTIAPSGKPVFKPTPAPTTFRPLAEPRVRGGHTETIT